MWTKAGEKGNFCTKVKPNIESIAFCHPFVQVLAAVKSYRYVDSFHHFIRLLCQTKCGYAPSVIDEIFWKHVKFTALRGVVPGGARECHKIIRTLADPCQTITINSVLIFLREPYLKRQFLDNLSSAFPPAWFPFNRHTFIQVSLSIGKYGGS